MTNLTIDFAGCGDEADFWRAIKHGLFFPDYFGENFAALWDCATDYCGGTAIEIYNLNALPRYFESDVSLLKQVFERLCEEYPKTRVEFMS